MAKGVGLIGNFKGKVGNTVGYNLKDSNNKQTQGIRVYQPIVKNPKSAGQAEQRARMAVINATYRALKDIICRGQEGVAYGNKSRLAWLSEAMKQFNGAWLQKGAVVNFPAIVPLTKGSLTMLGDFECSTSVIQSTVNGLTIGEPATIGALSTALLNANVGFKAGDQVTGIVIGNGNGGIKVGVSSFIIDATSTDSLSGWSTESNALQFSGSSVGITDVLAGAMIVSRESADGGHLRSTSSIVASDYDEMAAVMTPQAKAAAIASYMTAGVNSDWEQDPED